MYGQAEAQALNTLWKLHKERCSKESHTAEWWNETIALFNAIAETLDGDGKSCISHYAVAAIRDIEDKSLGKDFKVECHYMNDFTIDQFKDYLKDAKTGDMLTVDGVRIEVK